MSTALSKFANCTIKVKVGNDAPVYDPETYSWVEQQTEETFRCMLKTAMKNANRSSGTVAIELPGLDLQNNLFIGRLSEPNKFPIGISFPTDCTFHFDNGLKGVGTLTIFPESPYYKEWSILGTQILINAVFKNEATP